MALVIYSRHHFVLMKYVAEKESRVKCGAFRARKLLMKTTFIVTVALIEVSERFDSNVIKIWISQKSYWLRSNGELR